MDVTVIDEPFRRWPGLCMVDVVVIGSRFEALSNLGYSSLISTLSAGLLFILALFEIHQIPENNARARIKKTLRFAMNTKKLSLLSMFIWILYYFFFRNFHSAHRTATTSIKNTCIYFYCLGLDRDCTGSNNEYCPTKLISQSQLNSVSVCFNFRDPEMFLIAVCIATSICDISVYLLYVCVAIFEGSTE